nr:MAG TPA: cleavage stimulation factor domain protein [Caudoviricetes sp.]
MKEPRSHEIIEIIADVVKQTAVGCTVAVMDGKGGFKAIQCPEINYTFGNAQYVKDKLDELSKTPRGNEMKFPLIALFCPFEEKRDTPDCYSRASVNILIACSSMKQWSNEQRLQTSFRNVLRPIYRRFLDALREDGRFSIEYDGQIPHKYSENYSYGRYGAHTGTGEEVSEPIDAIDIRNLELKVKQPNCRRQ